jgi:hypothetical protein
MARALRAYDSHLAPPINQLKNPARCKAGFLIHLCSKMFVYMRVKAPAALISLHDKSLIKWLAHISTRIVPYRIATLETVAGYIAAVSKFVKQLLSTRASRRSPCSWFTHRPSHRDCLLKVLKGCLVFYRGYHRWVCVPPVRTLPPCKDVVGGVSAGLSICLAGCIVLLP